MLSKWNNIERILLLIASGNSLLVCFLGLGEFGGKCKGGGSGRSGGGIVGKGGGGGGGGLSKKLGVNVGATTFNESSDGTCEVLELALLDLEQITGAFCEIGCLIGLDLFDIPKDKGAAEIEE